RGEGRVEIAAPQVELAAAGEDVLVADRGRVAARIERAAPVERLRRAFEVAEVPVAARQMEQDLYLHAAPALPLLARCLVPDRARPRQRLDRLAGSMELLETVAAPEEAEMVGREGSEGTIVPAQRLGPLLLPLEVPADRAVEDRRPARRELGTA